MKLLSQLSLTLAACTLAAPAFAAESAKPAAAAAPLTVHVDGIEDKGAIPDNFVMCQATPDGKSSNGKNERPAISWSEGPAGTKSYAVIVTDPDVPADLSKAYTDHHISADAARQTFYHWVQVDIPAKVTSIKGSKDSAKPNEGKAASNDVNQKTPLGYGGPCPPWNDGRLHHYHFQVLALDQASLGLPSTVHGAQVAAVTEGHVLAKGEVVGTYTTNPSLRKK